MLPSAQRLSAKGILAGGVITGGGIAGTWGLILYTIGPTIVGAVFAVGSAALIRLTVDRIMRQSPT